MRRAGIEPPRPVRRAKHVRLNLAAFAAAAASAADAPCIGMPFGFQVLKSARHTPQKKMSAGDER